MGHTKNAKTKMAAQFRSTKGASKHRRDLINTEINSLRDILPLPESARQRLSQLQIMSLACCYIRKCNYFTRLFGNTGGYQTDAPFEFAQAMTGFLLITTREGKLLYISDNVTEYLGHSMVDMMTQGDSLYDIIDKRDHATVQNELLQTNYSSSSAATTGGSSPDEERTFFCRMNVSRSFRRHAGFGDHKVMHVRGHFLQPMLGDHYGSQPVFMATCTPLVTPDVKETAMQHNTLMFQSLHGLDMKYIEVAPDAEFHLGYTDAQLKDKSWYGLLHPEDIHEAREKHIQLVKSSHEMGCMLTVRLQAAAGHWVWVNMVMHIRQPYVCENGDPAIVCNNHVIAESEAENFKMQSQLYSSHIARSPEFVASPSAASPPHAIMQVVADHYGGSGSGGMQAEEQGNVTFRGEFGVIPATTGSIGSSTAPSTTSVTAPGSTMAGQQGGNGTGMVAPSTGRGSEPLADAQSGSQHAHQGAVDQKQLLRQDILNRLKRKMRSDEECRPPKQTRLSTLPDDCHRPSGGGGGSGSSGAGGLMIHGSIITSPISHYGGTGDIDASGSGGVLGPIINGPIYSELRPIKKEVDVLVQSPPPAVVAPKSDTPKINPKMATTMVDLSQPMTPLTPESMTSDSQESPLPVISGSTSPRQALSVEVGDMAAVVPASVLTPESSPSSSPNRGGGHDLQCVPLLNDLDDLSLFTDLDLPLSQGGVKTKRATNPAFISTSPSHHGGSALATQQATLAAMQEPEMLRLESMLDGQAALAALTRPTKQHATAQARIAEIVAALKEAEHAVERPATSANVGVVNSNRNNSNSNINIPVTVAAMEQTQTQQAAPQMAQQMANVDPSVNFLAEALMDLVQSRGADALTLADITGNFMLVPDGGNGDDVRAGSGSDQAPTMVGADDAFMSCLDVGGLTDEEASTLSTELLEELATLSPSHGEAEQLSKAVNSTL